MVRDEDIIFVTTTLSSKWLKYQSEIVKRHFPDSRQIFFNGTHSWPYSWFFWLETISSSEYTQKWFVHLDEDCFIESKDEIVRLISMMEEGDYTLAATSDGYGHYRGANAIAINSFFMIGNRQHFADANFDYKRMNFRLEEGGWKNDFGIKYKDSYSEGFEYTHEKFGTDNRTFEQEPYYALLWTLKEQGRKFFYLYPHFDERFKSTNPRIDAESADIAVHMWYTRGWNSDMDVWGLPNYERYQRVEKYLTEKR